MPNQEIIIRVPLPERLPPRAHRQSLMSTVKLFFYPLYDEDAEFRDFLVSVGNKDSKTKNRTIDRYKAIEMMVARAIDARDTVLPAPPSCARKASAIVRV
jgi:hypothetical protein